MRLAEDPLGGMEVDGPAPVGDPVLEPGRLEYLVLGQHGIAHEPPRLPFSGEERIGVDHKILRPMIAVVFDVVPDAEEHPEKGSVDVLVVCNGIEFPAVFDPPESV